MQCRLQLPNLAFRAFDHPSLPKQMATGNHTISLAGGTELPQTRRFNQLWKWYYTCNSTFLRQEPSASMREATMKIFAIRAAAILAVAMLPLTLVEAAYG